jgi:hypothetical protein
MNVVADKKREPGLLQMLREPAAWSYLLVALAALIIYCILMSDRTHDAGGNLGTLLTLIVAVPGLIGRWAISPILFLILTTYLLIDPNFDRLMRSTSHRHVHTGQIDDLLLGASVLVYLMAQFRLLSLLHKSMPDDPPPRRTGQAEPVAPRRPAATFADREIKALFVLALGCILAGCLAWLSISEFDSAKQVGGALGIQRPFAQLMMFFWGFMSASTLMIVFFRYRALRRMSRLEARLMLQDMFWVETRREQERIYRWRRWHRNRHTVDTVSDNREGS